MNAGSAKRLLLLEWDGATLGLLDRLAEAGRMPTWEQLRRRSFLWQLAWSGLGSPTAAWTTLRTGLPPERHGVWDESRLDTARRWAVAWQESALPSPALPELLPLRSPRAALALDDRGEAARIWSQKPESLAELNSAVQRTAALLDGLLARVRQSAAGDWQLLEIRLQVVALLQHRLWHLLEGDALRSRCPWSAAAQGVFQLLDQSLGQFWELAERHGATLAVASPYGFVPFRERITVVELLRQHGLLALANGSARLAYGVRRWLWRSLRRLDPGRANLQGIHGPVRSLLPLDWRRSRVVTFHGQHAALVYLNTPERFGTQVLATAAARDDALAETVAALRGARHPVSGESLFAKVFLNGAATSDAPDVIGLPTSGFLTRHKPDHRRHVLRGDASLSAVQGGDGLLLIDGAQPMPGPNTSLALVDAATQLAEALAGPSAAGDL